MNNHFTVIDPNQSHLPNLAVITQVDSEEDRLPEDEHKKAANAFLLSDSIASGIGKDFQFVKQIPQYIKQIIEGKLWECFYVAKGVVTPYYCRYTKGTDSENFRAFITAKRPNGLETTIDEIDNILNFNPEVQRQFRTFIYESRQGERTDLMDKTSGSDCPKSDLSERQQKNIRAASRAAEAIPIIGELLDRGLIVIDLAAKLGRDIKNSDNLTADEREYVDKRDLIGLRLEQYIYTSPIPEDEDKEPAYKREINRFIEDLLGIKDRSKSVRMDNPKKAADKLLQFYQGETLKTLIDYLQQGLSDLNKLSSVKEDPSEISKDPSPIKESQNGNIPQVEVSKELPVVRPPKVRDTRTERKATEKKSVDSTAQFSPHQMSVKDNQTYPETSTGLFKGGTASAHSPSQTTTVDHLSASKSEAAQLLENVDNMRLTGLELAKRLKVTKGSFFNAVNRYGDNSNKS